MSAIISKQRTPSPVPSEARSEARTPETKRTLSLKCPPTPRQRPQPILHRFKFNPERSTSIDYNEDNATEGVRQNSKKRRAEVSVEETVDDLERLQLGNGSEDAAHLSKKPRVAQSMLADQLRDRERLARQEHLRIITAKEESRVQLVQFLIHKKTCEIADIQRRALLRMDRIDNSRDLARYSARVARQVEAKVVAINTLTVYLNDPESLYRLSSV